MLIVDVCPTHVYDEDDRHIYTNKGQLCDGDFSELISKCIKLTK